MNPRPEQEARVRGQPEGRTVEAEEWLVHGELPRPLNGNDRGRYDDDHLLRIDAELAAPKEPAEDGDASEERDLALGLGVGVGQDAPDDEPLALTHDDLVLRSTLEDRRVAGARQYLREVGLVVLDEDLHPYQRDLALTNDPRGHLELEQRVVELHWRPTEAALAHVRHLEAARDDGCRILHGDRLRLRERPRLALRLERLDRHADIELASDDSEQQAHGGIGRGGQARRGKVQEVAAGRQPGGGIDGQDRASRERRIRNIRVQRRRCPACLRSGEPRHGVHWLRQPAAEKSIPVFLAHGRAAPLHPELLERVADDDHHLRRDLHLWQRDVELFLHETLDAGQIRFVVANEDGVGRLVRADGDALGQGFGEWHPRCQYRGRRLTELALRRNVDRRRRRVEPRARGWRRVRTSRRPAENALHGLGPPSGGGVLETDG